MTERKFRPVEHMVVADARPESRELFAHLSNSVNSGTRMYEVAMLMGSDHRTLQQSLVREFIVPFLLLLAQDYRENRYDARNEKSCELALKIDQAVNLDSYPLPFI
jgi:hypothetical protein